MNAHLRAGWRRVIAGDDYRMQHRPGGPDFGAPLHDLDSEEHGIFPHDVYDHPHYYTGNYGSGRKGDPEMVRQMNEARGKPDHHVTIYRALPKGHTTIRTGDWVTTSAHYAGEHAKQENPDHDWPVIKAKVPAKHVWNNGDDLIEQGYHGPDVDAEIHHPGGKYATRLAASLDGGQQRALDRLSQLPEDLVQGAPAHQLFAEHNIHLHEEDPWEAGEVGDGHVTKDTGRSRFHAPDAPLHTSQDYLWRPTLEHFIRHPEDATVHEERPSTWTHEGQHWINGGHHRILADRMSQAQGTEVSDRTVRTSALLTGRTISVRASQLPENRTCPVCRGIGDEPDGSGSECAACDGSGGAVCPVCDQDVALHPLDGWQHLDGSISHNRSPLSVSEAMESLKRTASFHRWLPDGSDALTAAVHSDDGRRLQRSEGDPMEPSEIIHHAHRTLDGLAAHYDVPKPKVQFGGVSRPQALSTYYPGGNGTLALNPDRLHTGNIDDVLVHEWTHHLDVVRDGSTEMDPHAAHGPGFLSRMQEVDRAHRHRTSAFTPDKRIFGPTHGLDHRLWDGDHLKHDVSAWVMETLDGFWRPVYGPSWRAWSRVYFAGSEASEWTSETREGNNDFDVLIGIDYERMRADLGGLYQMMDDEQITNALNKQLTTILWPRLESAMIPVEGHLVGPVSATFFVNQDSWDIRDIKPYAAYCISTDKWAVRPPHLPDWSIKDFPPAFVKEARAVEAYVRAVLALPEPMRAQQADALWRHLHGDRSRAFSAQGEGWWDPGNSLEKWLDQSKGDKKHSLWELLAEAHFEAQAHPEELLSPADWSNDPRMVGS